MYRREGGGKDIHSSAQNAALFVDLSSQNTQIHLNPVYTSAKSNYQFVITDSVFKNIYIKTQKDLILLSWL